MKRSTIIPASLATVLLILVPYSTSQVFKRHKIGETVEQFFSVAMVAETNTLTMKYCKDYLSDPKVMKGYTKSQANAFDTRAMMRSIDVKACGQVQDALDGKDAKIGARYAIELGGGGSATFHASRLTSIIFVLPEGTRFDDVVIDVKQELGGVEPTMAVETQQNAFGATLQSKKALWDVGKLNVVATEARSFRYPNMGVLVMVADSDFYKKTEAERQVNRPNTIR